MDDEDAGQFFILDDNHQPVPATIREWGEWKFTKHQGTVDRTSIPNGDGKSIVVSTVFVGYDPGHGYDSDRLVSVGKMLFETMLFVAGVGVGSRLYETWGKAKRGHEQWVAKATKKYSTF